MIASESEIRIRYDEVDKMGYVYHGNYAKYYHISRTDLMRKIGICDKQLESSNILLPVVDMSIKYLSPIFYDDIITIKTVLQNIPTAKMIFKHEVYDRQNNMINRAQSTVAFVDMETRKPMRPPSFIVEKIKASFNDQNH
jgi:acyl-CoA thioester hydrolase